jgi:hypothetical protein
MLRIRRIWRGKAGAARGRGTSGAITEWGVLIKSIVRLVVRENALRSGCGVLMVTLLTDCSALPAPFMMLRSLPCASHMRKSISLTGPPRRHGMTSARDTTGTKVCVGTHLPTCSSGRFELITWKGIVTGHIWNALENEGSNPEIIRVILRARLPYVQARRLPGIDACSKYSHAGVVAHCSWDELHVFPPVLRQFGDGAQLRLERDHSNVRGRCKRREMGSNLNPEFLLVWEYSLAPRLF